MHLWISDLSEFPILVSLLQFIVHLFTPLFPDKGLSLFLDKYLD